MRLIKYRGETLSTTLTTEATTEYGNVAKAWRIILSNMIEAGDDSILQKRSDMTGDTSVRNALHGIINKLINHDLLSEGGKVIEGGCQVAQAILEEWKMREVEGILARFEEVSLEYRGKLRELTLEIEGGDQDPPEIKRVGTGLKVVNRDFVKRTANSMLRKKRPTYLYALLDSLKWIKKPDEPGFERLRVVRRNSSKDFGLAGVSANECLSNYGLIEKIRGRYRRANNAVLEAEEALLAFRDHETSQLIREIENLDIDPSSGVGVLLHRMKDFMGPIEVDFEELEALDE